MAKYVRFEQNGVHVGELRGDQIIPLKGELPNFSETGEAPIPLSAVRLLAPVVPSKIVAVGPNYRAHFTAAGISPPPRPYLWIKPSSALLDPEGEIRYPITDVPMVCHESELAIVIGRTASNVDVETARTCIFGYSCINDVSAGELTNMAAYLQSQFFVDGKIFDTFAPFGPVIATDIEATDLRIQCRVNGEVRQDHRTSDQIWGPAELVSLISRTLTLNPGDVIATGSPPGPGPLKKGDTVEVEIDGIGILRNRVSR